MKADSLKISKVFSSGGDIHYILPHFQREYAWEKKHWDTLLNDAFAIYEEYVPEKEPEHFMGSLVVINDGTRNGIIPAFKLVDGQQRLTTISLLLCALGRIVHETHPALTRRTQRLLVNSDEVGELYYKLMPTAKYGDRVAYLAIVKGETPPPTESNIPQAYAHLNKELSAKITKGEIDPEKFFVVLTNCFQVVFIDLNQNEQPYKIFESLNAKGKDLSQADLVRNYIAMKLPSAGQEEVFTTQWSRIESLLQERRSVGRSRLGELTAFLRHYLAMRAGALCNEEHVYARFRDRIEKEFPMPNAFIDELSALRRFAEHYDKLLRPENEPRAEIQKALKRLNTLEITTAYPFLLAAYDAQSSGHIRVQDLQEALTILENYIVRRYVTGEPTNYLNKMFPTLWRDVNPQQFAPSLREVLVGRNYPSDNKVRQAVFAEELYDSRIQTREKTVLVLETINRHLSVGSGGYTELDDRPTIEHIMPQQSPPSDAWKGELGADWEQTHENYLHTLGNLTLVTQQWNSALSNDPFATKKQTLARHALRINSDYFSQNISRWSGAAIRDRASFLTKNILEIWPALGEAPPSQTQRRPVAVTILGDRYDLDTWRDLAVRTSERVIEWQNDFPAIAAQFPQYFRQEPAHPRYVQLSNGWWLNVNLNSKMVKSFCRRLTQAAGIPETEWELEEE